MSYEPTIWQAGDIVTSAKLNKMEQGIATNNGILILHEDENHQLDKTWQEIHDADLAIIIADMNDGKKIWIIVEAATQGFDTEFYIVPFDDNMSSFRASTPNDYPIRYSTQESN